MEGKRNCSLKQFWNPMEQTQLGFFYSFLIKKNFFFFFLPHNLWDVSSQTRDRTRPSAVKAESWPLDRQGIPSVRFQGLGIILCGLMFCPLGPHLHPESSSFFIQGSTCLQLSSIMRLFPAYRILRVRQPSFISSFSVPVSPSWQCFCWYDMLKNLRISHVCHSQVSSTGLFWIIPSLFFASTEMVHT